MAEPRADGKVLIWTHKHGGAWWRENAHGYTSDILAAGFYEREEAEVRARATHGECVPVEPTLAFGIVMAEQHRRHAQSKADEVTYWYRHFASFRPGAPKEGP